VTLLVAAALVLAPLLNVAAPAPRSTPAILRAGVIHPRDVPAGWTASLQDQTALPFAGVAPCAAINAADATARRRAARAASPRFTDPQSAGTTAADNTVDAFRSAPAAARDLAAYQAPDAAACLQAVLTQAGGPGATVTVTPLASQLHGLGDANAGYEGTIAGRGQQGQPIALVADLVAVRVGRAVVVFEFLNANRPIPEGPGIVDTVVGRLTGR